MICLQIQEISEGSCTTQKLLIYDNFKYFIKFYLIYKVRTLPSIIFSNFAIRCSNYAVYNESAAI